ncbi:leucine-rich repeat domain-containing protein, partial [Coprococcus eutactus]
SEFLERFPRLRVVHLQGFALDAVPESILSMENLTDLHLKSSEITLTPDTAHRLGGMEHLEYIDLDDNP